MREVIRRLCTVIRWAAILWIVAWALGGAWVLSTGERASFEEMSLICLMVALPSVIAWSIAWVLEGFVKDRDG